MEKREYIQLNTGIRGLTDARLLTMDGERRLLVASTGSGYSIVLIPADTENGYILLKKSYKTNDGKEQTLVFQIWSYNKELGVSLASYERYRELYQQVVSKDKSEGKTEVPASTDADDNIDEELPF